MPFNHKNLKAYQRTLLFNVNEELSQVPRMLVGLRKSWAQSRQSVREDSAEYAAKGEGEDKVRDKDSRETFDKARDKARDKDISKPKTNE